MGNLHVWSEKLEAFSLDHLTILRLKNRHMSRVMVTLGTYGFHDTDA